MDNGLSLLLFLKTYILSFNFTQDRQIHYSLNTQPKQHSFTPFRSLTVYTPLHWSNQQVPILKLCLAIKV